MAEYIFFMHDDATHPADSAAWGPYLAKLQRLGVFQGGSEIGDGRCVRRDGAAAPMSRHLEGFIRIEARSLEEAQTLLSGNPVYEAGGTIEIRELPRSD